uniref:Uncharacterized protein n=1 Tax=Trichogramma kaykai TaxID=54128 RepID=A0ABD2WKJ5_9HYME
MTVRPRPRLGLGLLLGYYAISLVYAGTRPSFVSDKMIETASTVVNACQIQTGVTTGDGHRVGARRSMAREPGAQVLHVLPVGAVRPRRREERAQSQRNADLLPAHPGLSHRGAERHQRVQGARQIFRDRRQLRVRLHLQQVLRRKIAKGEPPLIQTTYI